MFTRDQSGRSNPTRNALSWSDGLAVQAVSSLNGLPRSQTPTDIVFGLLEKIERDMLDARLHEAFHPLTMSHVVPKSGYMPVEEAKALLDHVALAFAPCTGKRSRAELPYAKVVRELGEALDPFKLRLREVRAESDGREYLAFASGDAGAGNVARSTPGGSASFASHKEGDWSVLS